MRITIRPLILLFCLHTTIQAQDKSFQLPHDGLQRSFLVHTPCHTFDCHNKLLPVVMVFHGLGQNAGQIRDYSFFNNIADTAGFVVVYPQGDNNGWNVGFTLANPTSTDDVGFIEKLIQFLLANNDCQSGICAQIDTQSIFACGMSNGGFFSYHLACNLSHRMAAIASVTGSMTDHTYNNCQPSRPVPVLEIHGDADVVVPYTGSALSGAKPIQQVLNFWRDHNGCPVNPTTYNIADINTTDSSTVKAFLYEPCNGNSKILHYKVLGGGHCWPGSATAPGLGPTNMDINASEEIWKFFKQFISSSSTTIGHVRRHGTLTIFPNPVAHTLTIHTGNNAYKTIHLFDLTGKKLMTCQTTAYDVSVRLDQMAVTSGMYMLEYTDEFVQEIRKIIIQY